MSASHAVLALVADPALRGDVDRVAAAAGLRVVHAADPSSRKVWTAASAVLLDVAAAQRCVDRSLPRRGHVVVVGQVEPCAADWQTAIAVGAQQVLTLPGHDAQLMTELTEAIAAAGDVGGRGPVLAIVAGRGGAGASVFATTLAYCASRALLVDVDPWSGGLELVLGSEADTGLRWPDLSIQGGRLEYAALRDALPRRRQVSLLSGTRAGFEVEAAPLAAVIEAGSRAGATVICDLPRRSTAAAETALDAADLVAVVAAAEVRSAAATAAIGRWLVTLNANVGVVVRGPSPGGLSARDVATIAQLPLLAAMRPQPGLAAGLERGGLRLARRSPLVLAARQVLSMLSHSPTASAA